MKYVHALSSPSARPRVVRGALLALVSFGLASCGSVELVATTNIPTPLVEKAPVTVALHVPEEFQTYVHKEERWSTDWNIALGAAQTDGIKRLMNAMFERVVLVDSVNEGAQLGGNVRAIFEPSVEEYAFVTPRDAGSPFFAVSIKYRVNIYSPDGRLADSWGFTGYGTSPAQGLSSTAPLAQATSLAMRDAGAKLAVEFRDQAIVRGLLPETAESPASTPQEAPPQAPIESAPAPAPESPPAGSPPAGSPSSEPPASPPGEAPAAPETPELPAEQKQESESTPAKTNAPSLALIPSRVRARAAFGTPGAG